MRNIELYITDMAQEDVFARLRVEYLGDDDEFGPWRAYIEEGKMLLLDRRGELYMQSHAETLEEALAELDQKAGR